MFPILPANSAAAASENDEGIFGYGYIVLSMTNLVSNAGVVSSDVAGVGTGRGYPAATQYGGDKGIFFGGALGDPTYANLDETNLVSNTGVVSSGVTGIGTPRERLAGCSYGGDKGIFGFGSTGSYVSTTNLVSNAGVVSSDVAGVGTARGYLAACSYGDDKGIFGFGYNDYYVWSATNLVSNAGVVSSDVAGVGQTRLAPAATQYGGDKGIFGFGSISPYTAITNLVSNTGVVASDQAAETGTVRQSLSACSFN